MRKDSDYPMFKGKERDFIDKSYRYVKYVNVQVHKISQITSVVSIFKDGSLSGPSGGNCHTGFWIVYNSLKLVSFFKRECNQPSLQFPLERPLSAIHMQIG